MISHRKVIFTLLSLRSVSTSNQHIVVPERILDFFPLPDLPPQEPIDSEFEVALNRLELVQKDRVFNQPVRIDEDESVKRPGEFYKRYVIAATIDIV